MKLSSHLEKFDRFDALRKRFDPEQEFELWYWMGLSAGTAIINAALHCCALTKENDLFATQVPDVYVVVDADGRWHRQLGTESDLIHVGLPPVKGPVPQEIASAFEAMEIIERYRDPCIRGDHPITHSVITECDEAYRRCVAHAQKLIRHWRV